MKQSKSVAKKVVRKKLQFYHKNNRRFTGIILAETEDFYTIELTCDVAGLNAIWYEGEKVRWSRALTSVLKSKKT